MLSSGRHNLDESLDSGIPCLVVRCEMKSGIYYLKDHFHLLFLCSLTWLIMWYHMKGVFVSFSLDPQLC